MKALVVKLTSKKAQGYANQVGSWFTSLPQLPKGLIEFFVKVVPYLALLSAVVALIFGPIVTVLSIFFIFTAGNTFIFLSTLILAVLFFVSGLILFSAFAPLKKRQQNGWLLLFWAEAIMTLETVTRIVFGHTKIFSLLGTVLVFYVLFQMRGYYKKK
jgi:hypothetical protein